MRRETCNIIDFAIHTHINPETQGFSLLYNQILTVKLLIPNPFVYT